MTLRPAAALTLLGASTVVAGGLVAAVTGPFDWTKGSWAAAYLVLVVGVAQYVMGGMRARHTGHGQAPALGWVQVGTWNLGSALVIGATLAGRPLLVDAGSVLLVVALVIALHATRTGPSAPTGPPTLIAWGYRAMLLVLAVSIPVGMLLSHLRH